MKREASLCTIYNTSEYSNIEYAITIKGFQLSIARGKISSRIPWVSGRSDKHFRLHLSQACWVSNIDRNPACWVSNIDRVSNDSLIIEYWSHLRRFLEYRVDPISVSTCTSCKIEYSSCLRWFLEYRVDPTSAFPRKIVEYRLRLQWFLEYRLRLQSRCINCGWLLGNLNSCKRNCPHLNNGQISSPQFKSHSLEWNIP